MSMLVTLSKYKAAIGETDSANDSRHTEAIEDASSAVKNFTDRDFAAPNVTETRTFFVPARGYIIDIDDASEITDVEGLGAYNWIARGEGPADSYGVYTYLEAYVRRTSPLMGFTRNEDVFGSDLLQTIDVTGTWGWPTVPDDVQRATIWTAAAMENDSQNLSGSLAAKAVAEVSWNFQQQQQQTSGGRDDEQALPARARGLLYPYRRY